MEKIQTQLQYPNDSTENFYVGIGVTSFIPRKKRNANEGNPVSVEYYTYNNRKYRERLDDVRSIDV